MRPKRLQQNSRSAELLQELGGMIDDISLGLSRPGLVVRYGIDGTRKFLDRKERYFRNQELKRLEKRKLIKTKKISSELEVKLTKLGIQEFIRLEIIKSEIHPKGTVCMVIFDIPESERALRKKIRDILSKAAFIPLQRSVWISNIDAADSLVRLFKKQEKKKWIRVITAHLH